MREEDLKRNADKKYLTFQRMKFHYLQGRMEYEELYDHWMDYKKVCENLRKKYPNTNYTFFDTDRIPL